MSKLDWKIFNASHEMIGSTMHAEDAAALVAMHTDGYVKWNHAVIVWREGRESQPASESYDFAAGCMLARMRGYNRRRYERLTASAMVSAQLAQYASR